MEFRAASPADAPAIGRILAAGFEDDPVLAWTMSEPGRLRKLEALMTFAAAETFAAEGGATWWSDDVAACWLAPPGRQPDDEARGLRIGQALVEAGCTDDDLGRLAVMGEAMGRAHPHEPHWYLGIVATRPDRRGTGLGTRILGHSLGPVDDDGSPAYLESSNPRNISLYERHGFEVTGLIEIPGGPPMYPMWRPAR